MRQGGAGLSINSGSRCWYHRPGVGREVMCEAPEQELLALSASCLPSYLVGSKNLDDCRLPLKSLCLPLPGFSPRATYLPSQHIPLHYRQDAASTSKRHLAPISVACRAGLHTRYKWLHLPSLLSHPKTTPGPLDLSLKPISSLGSLHSAASGDLLHSHSCSSGLIFPTGGSLGPRPHYLRRWDPKQATSTCPPPY